MRKLYFLSMAVAVAAAVVSCTKEDVRIGALSVSEGEPVTLRVGVSTTGTKVTGNVTASEETVKTLQIFVFNENGELERSGYVTNDTGVEISCFAGVKDVVAIVNAQEIDWLKISSLEDLTDKITKLEENSSDKLFMYGRAEANVTASGSVTVPVTRRVARVVLNKVTNEVASSSSVGELHLKSVYLINVVGDAEYAGSEDYVPKSWYNQSRLDDADLTSSPYSLLYDGIGDTLVGYGTPYTVMHTFYCYPNLTSTTDGDESTSTATRLVVEATLNGRLWYYPVTIEDIKSNVSYEIDMTITGVGADSPDSDPQIEDYNFIVKVDEWTVKDIEATI